MAERVHLPCARQRCRPRPLGSNLDLDDPSSNGPAAISVKQMEAHPNQTSRALGNQVGNANASPALDHPVDPILRKADHHRGAEVLECR